MRKVKVMEHQVGNWEVKLFRSDDFGEYCIRQYHNGHLHEELDYYTDDKDDAIKTLRVIYLSLFDMFEE